MVNIGDDVADDVADAIPTVWLASLLGVTGQLLDVEDVGDDESELEGDGGVLGGEAYRATVAMDLTGLRRGTCCNFWCS